MARPRAFDTEAALDEVTAAFWSRGYEATSLADLEAGTGLSRSSLYQAFGGKREMFEAALTHYQEQQIDPTLRNLEAAGAGMPELRAYMSVLARTLRGDPELAQRGCLVVNSMSELASHDADARMTSMAYRQRIIDALANALRGASETPTQRRQAPRRARVLATTVIGILVTAHLDPEGAADLCDDLARDLAGEFTQ